MEGWQLYMCILWHNKCTVRHVVLHERQRADRVMCDSIVRKLSDEEMECQPDEEVQCQCCMQRSVKRQIRMRRLKTMKSIPTFSLIGTLSTCPRNSSIPITIGIAKKMKSYKASAPSGIVVRLLCKTATQN